MVRPDVARRGDTHGRHLFDFDVHGRCSFDELKNGVGIGLGLEMNARTRRDLDLRRTCAVGAFEPWGLTEFGGRAAVEATECARERLVTIVAGVQRNRRYWGAELQELLG